MRNTRRALLPRYAKELFVYHRYKVMYGGRGGARSWSAARALLIKAAAQTLRVLCAREIQSSIKDSVHKLLQDQIELLGLTGFTITHTEIRHVNGSLFIFEGLRSNAHTIKSLEGIDICWVEEAERVPKESWDILIPTIRKDGSEIWVTFNPDEESDNTYQRFIVNTPPDAWVVKVNWRDNPWLTPILRQEKDFAYQTDTESADHIWEGNLRKISAAQILRGKWKVEEFTPFLGHQRESACVEMLAGLECPHAWSGPYQGMDFGFADDPFAAMRAWVYETTLYLEYEVWGLHVEQDDIPTLCTETIPGFAQYVTRADSARPDTISYLQRHGLPRVVGVKKHPGSVEDGIAHLRGAYTAIVVHPRCKHWKDEAIRYKYKVDERSGDVLPIVIDKHNHLMDSTRYSLEPMIKPRRLAGFLFPQKPDTRPVGAQRLDEVDAEALSHTGNGNGNGKPKPQFAGLNSRR